MGLSASSGPETVPAAQDGAIAEQTRAYGSGARLLSIGIAATGLLTFAYFAISSHVLGEVPTKRIDVLWSVMFVIISVIYRPIEQLLSRTIAQRRARGANSSGSESRSRSRQASRWFSSWPRSRSGASSCRRSSTATRPCTGSCS